MKFLDESKLATAEHFVSLYDTYMSETTDTMRDPSLRGFMKWLRERIAEAHQPAQ